MASVEDTSENQSNRHGGDDNGGDGSSRQEEEIIAPIRRQYHCCHRHKGDGDETHEEGDNDTVASLAHLGSLQLEGAGSPPPSDLLKLIMTKHYRLAREYMDAHPEHVYKTYGSHRRLAIHELCKYVSTAACQLDDMQGEISDDEDEADEDEMPNAACSTCVRKEIGYISELVAYMIDLSHLLGPVKIETSPCPDELGGENENENSNADGEGDGSDSRSSFESKERERFTVYESILCVRDSCKKTPLHLLCETSAETSMLSVLLKGSREHCHSPSAPSVRRLITAKDRNGSTPLHYLAYSRKCPISSLRLAMDHCGMKSSSSASELSLAVFDEGSDPTLCTDDDGDTPLHWALDGYMSARRIEQLVRHSKDALRVENNAGKRPFDQFADNFVETDWNDNEVYGREVWDNIQEYLKVMVDDPTMCFPPTNLKGEETGEDAHGSSQAEPKDSWLPLHFVAGSPEYIPSVFVDIALHYNKHDASVKNAQGLLPLHLACDCLDPDRTTSKGEPIIRRILSLYPQAANKTAGPHGRLPLHMAIESQKSLRIILTLLKAYPNSLNVPDPKTKLYPFLLACMDMDVSYSLLRADPSFIQLTLKAISAHRNQRVTHALQHDVSDLYAALEQSHTRPRYDRSELEPEIYF